MGRFNKFGWFKLFTLSLLVAIVLSLLSSCVAPVSGAGRFFVNIRVVKPDATASFSKDVESSLTSFDAELATLFLNVTDLDRNTVVITNQQINKSQPTVTIQLTRPGNYRFEVTGRNSNGTVIMSGRVDRQITTNADVTVPLTFENGTISFTITIDQNVLSRYNLSSARANLRRISSSQTLQRNLTLSGNTISFSENVVPGTWEVTVELDFAAKEATIQPANQRVTYTDVINVLPAKTSTLANMSVYFDSSYNIRISVGVDLPYIPPVTNLTGTYTRSSGTLQLTWQHPSNTATYRVFRRIRVNEWGSVREKWELVGTTNQKTYSFNVSNADFDNVLQAVAVEAVENNKESGWVILQKTNITQR